jgi:uncharacterized protein (UPF0332 family)
MQPREFLELAKELSKRDSEACRRTTISRAYYAAFHETRALLAGWGFAIRQSDQAHTAVTRRLANSGSTTLSVLSQQLVELKRVRNQADYDLQREISASRVVRELIRVDEVLRIIVADLGHAERDTAIQKIRDYERNVLRDVTWFQS